MLTNVIKQPAEFKENSRPSKHWTWSHILNGQYSGDYSKEKEPDKQSIPEANRLALLNLLRDIINEEVYLAWLDSFAEFDYLETELAELPEQLASNYVSGINKAGIDQSTPPTNSMKHGKNSMRISYSGIMIYARNIEKTAAFYEKYFYLKRVNDKDSTIITLADSTGNEIIRIHLAGKAVKLGQAAVKLIFEVSDVEKFIMKSKEKGLQFGTIHAGSNYKFANTKDPDGNRVQITRRKQGTMTKR